MWYQKWLLRNVLFHYNMYKRHNNADKIIIIGPVRVHAEKKTHTGKFSHH